jgi:uncharacterized BrkB/YihY/UPF0761 family membrane protein
VSSAALVPETRTLTGDDAIKVLRRVGKGQLLKAALRRFRVADGFSHARSLAFLIALVCIQGIIGLVGLSNLLHQGNFSRVVVATIRKIVPGPAGRELTTAVVQAHRAVDSHHYSAILFATIAGLIAATTAMGQLERGLNRIYGVEQDRPSVLKYGFAFLLALSAGTLAILSFACLAFTRTIFQGTNLGFIASSCTNGSRRHVAVSLVAAPYAAAFFLARFGGRHISRLVGSRDRGSRNFLPN